jgi:hypothetical protein
VGRTGATGRDSGSWRPLLLTVDDEAVDDVHAQGEDAERPPRIRAADRQQGPDRTKAAADDADHSAEVFWPGAARIFSDIDSPIALAFLARYPSPDDARALGPSAWPRSSRGTPTAAARPPSSCSSGCARRAQSIGLVDGPGVRIGHSIMWGFGLEAVDGADKRAALLRNAMGYFGAGG